MQRHAFSLVELSIVLVILGLLTGGILAGQSLIRASELRDVSEEEEEWSIALGDFREKYLALPGDMTNATRFWGDDSSSCSDASIADGTPGTCNGNGDGIMNEAASNGATSERFRYWQQLALAGLVEGSFSGTSGASGTNQAIIDTNVPHSKLGSAGWSLWYADNTYAGDAATFASDYGNTLVFGAATTADKTQSPILKSEEAWNIDTKLDDGLPARGQVFGNSFSTCTNAASKTDIGTDYKLSTSSPNACTLYFRKLS